MRRFTIISALLVFFSSCSKDETSETTMPTNYFGQWKLVRMSGTMTNSVTVGSEMAWQEFYIFKENGTFIKSRIKNDVQTTVSGTYIVKNIQEEQYLELTYPDASDIIGSCYGNQKEELYYSKNNTLSSTWNHCDGPGLEYQQIEL